MQKLALSLIRFYQRYLSPYKGFVCAYRAHTQCASCSALGYRAIRRLGVADGIGVLRKRLRKCRAAFERYAPPPRLHSRQAGFCEVLACAEPAAYFVPDLACLALDYATTKEDKDYEEELRKMHLPPQRPPRLKTGHEDDDIHPSEGGWTP